MTVRKGEVIVRRNQFTITGIDYTSARLIVPIVTTRACKAKFYWNGPNSDIKVYAPTITTLQNAVAANTYASGTTSFPIDLTQDSQQKAQTLSCELCEEHFSERSDNSDCDLISQPICISC